MRIAILALQGAFEEHQRVLERLGVESFLVRGPQDWQQPKDGLIIPGGESTAMMRILRDEKLLEPVREAILAGLPVFGTCAGLILLDREHLGCMDMLAKRNAYGRQLGSFETLGKVEGIEKEVLMTFIRAPYIQEWGESVQPLAFHEGRLVAALEGNKLVTAFHPELTEDTSVHEFWIEMVRKKIEA